ncbi:MAG: formate dehydrogenase [Desulfobacterales bacterium CG23_combo_of_CG06-09_8_20_14_all_52_9]|nr:MAG: formate dehydrogenase [Desulfobacterales bacterium CG23_combo_of_CG06-09_8_20_14_all_52_9]
MTTMAKIDLKEQNPLEALKQFFAGILKLKDVTSILVPQRLSTLNTIMPTLVTDAALLEGVDPLAPAFPMNAARIASRLTRKPMGGKVAAVLRPCEIRAFIELVKLNQAHREEILLISTDCLGAFPNKEYFKFAAQDGGEETLRFYKTMLGGNTHEMEGYPLAPACKACEHPVSENADIQIGLYGIKPGESILIKAQSEAGDEMLKQMNLPETTEPTGRQAAIDTLISQRIRFRDDMFAKTQEAVNSLDKMGAYFSNCVNCYNCRVACPVCYCKECVFVTDVFDHEPSQYLQWAARKGMIKMPTDTLFYHLTRLAHMSTACVGCGQCSNACPNDIPIMEVFRTVAQHTQQAFGYEAGKNLEEKPPLSVFFKDEFQEVVGIS